MKLQSLLLSLSVGAALILPSMPLSSRAAEPPRLYHGAAYYPELWPDGDVDKDIVEMKKVGINVVRMGEFAWAKMEPDEGVISLDYFIHVMDKLHAAGIGVVFCTPTATPPVWLTFNHPERCFVDQQGEVMIHGARQHASDDNPEVQAACWRIVEAVAKAVGNHPALVAWQIDNELKCHVAEDFSDSSVAHWHEWLKKRYGTIDKLNDAWGTEIWSERYQNFEQVPAPRKTPFLHNASLSTAWLMFSREDVAEFQDKQAEIIRRYSKAPITQNTNLGFAVNFERMSQNLDFEAFDDYPSSSEYVQIIRDCDIFRGAKPGRPFWVMETSSAYNGWLTNYLPAHPPGFLVAEAVACYGLGSEAFSYWLWRQQRTGCELPHSAILSSWDKPGLGYESVRNVEAARQQLEPLLTTSKPAMAEAAVTWSDRGRAFIDVEPLGNNADYKVSYVPTVNVWHDLMLDAGLHRDFRFEGAPLDGLKLLVTPAMPYVSDEFRNKVEAWVREGGIWICGPLTGIRTEEHGAQTEAGLGALDGLGGIETVFSYPMTGTDAAGTAFGITAPLSGWCTAFKVIGEDTKEVGAIKAELAPGLSFITERKLGKGAIVMIGAQPQGVQGSAMLSKLITHYAKQAGVKERYTASKGTLVCPRVTNDGRTLWIVVNMDGMGGQVTLPHDAKDALNGSKVPAGPVKLARYEFRALQF